MAERDEKTPVHEISVKASECPVSKVTVYKDRAEVFRELDTTVKEGVNELHIKEFVTIDEDSIRVEGKGNATIAEVIFQSKFVSEEEASMTEKEKELKSQLKLLKEEKRALDLDSQNDALKKQWKILDQFASTAARHGQGDEPGDKQTFPLDGAYFKGMREFMQQYKDIGKQLEAERLDLEKKNEELNKKIETVEKNLEEVCGKKYNGHENRECVVVLEAEKEANVQLTVSYVVWGAFWSPSYDLRMFTDQGLLKIFYYGHISQCSGEDWNNVKLHLSTAQPSVGGSIPELPSTHLAVKRHRPIKARPVPKGGFALISKRATREEAEVFTCDRMADSEGLECMAFSAPMLPSEVQVSETTTSTSYEIARLSTIPSDNTPHKVTVAIIELKPTLTYVTVPKVVPHAFLLAKVTNTSQYTLLAGRTNIFLDNSFVAKAEINAVSPKEEFECSLGVDPTVGVEYKPLIKVNSSSGIISKTQCITHEQAINIKNKHDYNIKVTVKENLPRSLDDKIKVNLLSPSIDMKHPEKNENVRLTKDNNVEWDITIKGMDKTEVILKYTVEHPANESLEVTTGN